MSGPRDLRDMAKPYLNTKLVVQCHHFSRQISHHSLRQLTFRQYPPRHCDSCVCQHAAHSFSGAAGETALLLCIHSPCHYMRGLRTGLLSRILETLTKSKPVRPGDLHRMLAGITGIILQPCPRNVRSDAIVTSATLLQPSFV